MIKTTFPNNYRHPITGEAYGLHSGPFDWISQLGLTDHEGMPFSGERKRDALQKYGYGAVRENPDQQVTLHSNSGDHDYDQAATYLAQQAFQQGRTWFPKLGPAIPPEYAVRAAQELQKLNSKSSSWSSEDQPSQKWWESPESFLAMQVSDPNEYALMEWSAQQLRWADAQVSEGFKPGAIAEQLEQRLKSNSGINYQAIHHMVLDWESQWDDYYMNAFDPNDPRIGKTAELRDPVTEPNWMAQPSWDDGETCKYCGLKNCTHRGNSGELIEDPKIIWHGMWEYENPHGVNV